MSFSYIKMFFFLSLAIVFLFVLLMCYYLKNKIEVVEKRVSSQTDVLGKLIREFKLQACFGGGGGGGGGGEFIQGQQGIRLEPVLEVDDSDDDSTDYEDEADTDDDTDVGMEKVQDNDLLSAKEHVEDETDDILDLLDEYRGLNFEKVANEELPLDYDFTTGEDIDETVRVTPEDRAKYEVELDESNIELEAAKAELEAANIELEAADAELDAAKAAESEAKAELAKAVAKESEAKAELDNEESQKEKEAKTEDYHKMSLVQLKHVAQHTFHLSTTQIAKMKKDDLLKWVLAQ